MKKKKISPTKKVPRTCGEKTISIRLEKMFFRFLKLNTMKAAIKNAQMKRKMKLVR